MDNIIMKERPASIRPRERGIQVGVGHLTDQELIAILLRNGYENHSVMEVSSTLLGCFKTLKNIASQSVEELCQIKGIGKAKAVTLLAALELGKRCLLFEEQLAPVISSSKKAALVFERELMGLKKEHFLVIQLTTKNHILNVETISIGSLNASIVHPREVFKGAVKNSAATIVLGHNHPSGDPNPSEEDCDVTQRIIESGKLLGIDVIDHIIIGNNSYFSFKEEGLM